MTAQSSEVDLVYSFDISSSFGSSVFGDEDVERDALKGLISPIELGALPSYADLVAYHFKPNGAHLFSLDTSIQLPGLAEIRPSDVVSYDGSDYAIIFSGATNGLPSGARIDALTIAANSDLLISFDVNLDLSGLYAEDRDLLRWNGSSWSVFFDGSNEGVPDGVDLDAVHLLSSGRLLFSFDSSGIVGGLVFDDEDILQYDPTSRTWASFWDGSFHRPEIITADLDALSVIEEGPSAIFSDGFESGDLSLWSGSRP